MSAAALKKDESIRIAISGVVPYPFRSYDVERALNDKSMPIENRVEKAVMVFKDKITGGITASAGYKEFVVKNALDDIITELGGI